MMCHVEYIIAFKVLISEKEIVSITGEKKENQDNSYTNTMENFPQLVSICLSPWSLD